ncbi:branched-chain amino acid ABC transporter permease [Demequina lutea]|uniref:Branched-chain amino acid transport system permease protein n=1 Tax=Demequina lutea TaxID=431489 RepID=A0A7Y9ZC85_9MICO|nr:branched-chain amino acid ABC transporter permease [Demequina lutea]NYI41543.1 branched-chain amino acid transport system permease protein [Demequina lutea]
MRAALDTRAIVRAGVILVVVALAMTLYSAFIGNAGSDSSRAISAAGATTGTISTTAINEAPIAPLSEASAVTGVATATDPTPTHVNRLAQNVVNGVTFGLLLALASVGLSLIYGTTGLSNFAHGEQVSFGAILTYFLATSDKVSLPLIPKEFTIGLPLVVAAILAVIIAGGSGWLQDKFLWGPLRRKRVGVVQQMIVSIGLSLALVNLLQWWMGGRKMRLTTSIDTRHHWGGIEISNQTIISMVIAIVCLLAVSWFLLYTRLGRATRAVSDNPSLAAASGIKVDSIVRLVWILAAALAAVGGILLALYEQATSFDAGSRMLLLMFAAVTLGGLGQPFGALVGSLVIGIVVEVSTLWLPPDLKFATALAILIVVLLFRPQGILGRPERVG